MAAELTCEVTSSDGVEQSELLLCWCLHPSPSSCWTHRWRAVHRQTLCLIHQPVHQVSEEEDNTVEPNTLIYTSTRANNYTSQYLRHTRVTTVLLFAKSVLLSKVIKTFRLFPHIIKSHTFCYSPGMNLKRKKTMRIQTFTRQKR